MRYLMQILCLALLLGVVACSSPKKEMDVSQEAKYHKLMGASALNEGNPSDALREYLEAEKFDDSDPEIQVGLAEAYLRKRSYDNAELHFKRAIELSDNEPQYYNNLGVLYLNMKRYDEAIEAFKAAAENLLFDRAEVAYTGMGFAYYQKGDYAAAERAYRRALEINSRYFQISYRLGELYYAQGRTVEAAEEFSRAVHLAPGFAEGHYWLGLTYMKMEQKEKAKKAFGEVVRLAPESEEGRLAQKYLDILK